jgi:hypothetical protein
MKWISVKDRLPEDHKKIIVYGRSKNEWEVSEGWFEKNHKGSWPYKLPIADRWIMYLDQCCRDELFWDEVTHWMPLPMGPHEMNETFKETI